MLWHTALGPCTAGPVLGFSCPGAALASPCSQASWAGQGGGSRRAAGALLGPALGGTPSGPGLSGSQTCPRPTAPLHLTASRGGGGLAKGWVALRWRTRGVSARCSLECPLGTHTEPRPEVAHPGPQENPPKRPLGRKQALPAPREGGDSRTQARPGRGPHPRAPGPPRAPGVHPGCAGARRRASGSRGGPAPRRLLRACAARAPTEPLRGSRFDSSHPGPRHADPTEFPPRGLARSRAHAPARSGPGKAPSAPGPPFTCRIFDVGEGHRPP